MRTGVCVSGSSSLWATGSYDHTIKLWDCRPVLTAASAARADDAEEGEAEDAPTPSGACRQLWVVLAFFFPPLLLTSSVAHFLDHIPCTFTPLALLVMYALAVPCRFPAVTSRPPRAVRTVGGLVMTLDHGRPVSAVLALPGGAAIASAGGNVITIWDVLAGGKLVHTFSNHQKVASPCIPAVVLVLIDTPALVLQSITALCLDGTGTRLLSASLDCHVKVYDLQSYDVVFGVKYPAPILSLAIAVRSPACLPCHRLPFHAFRSRSPTTRG